MIGSGRIIDSTIGFEGTAPSDAVVEIYLNGQPIASSLSRNDGTWSLDYTNTVLAPGSYSITLTAVQPNGVETDSLSPFDFVYDPNAPLPPVITGIANDSASPGDGITNDNTLVITGTSEAASQVQVFLDGVSVGTVTAGAQGNWSLDYTGTAIPDGSHILSAQSAYLTLVSATSAQFPIVIDTQAPAVPANIHISPDTGVSSTDGITNNSRLVISGTGESLATVRVSLNGSVVGSTTVATNGAWSLDYSGVSLADGSYQLQAQQWDRAGNQSPLSAATTIQVDTTAPAAVTGLSVQPDTGVVGDGITASHNLVFSGNAPAQRWVIVYLDGTALGTVQADSSGVWQYDNSAVTLPDGAYQLTARTMDAAGNLAPASNPLTVQVDTTAPATPVITGFSTDTGALGDGLTADNTPLLSGTAEAGVQITVLQNGVFRGTTTADGTGHWQYDTSAGPLADGLFSFTAQATDSAGNVSAVSSALTISVDTVAPAAPVVSGISTDTGTAGDGITSDNTLVISGTSEANATVTVLVDGVTAGTTTANGSGNWTYDNTASVLADGPHVLTATASDNAGNVSTASAAYNITVITATLAAPVVTGITTDTGTAGDGITSDNTLVISGTAKANATVTVLLDGSSIGTTTANSSGNWSFDNTATSLADGSHSITAIATDSAGNSSAASSGFAIIVDTVTPAAPAVTGISTDTGTVGDGITSDNTLVISGTSEANATVIMYVDGSSVGTTTANGSGVWSFDNTAMPLADGVHALTAVARDSAGNTSAASSAYNITIDTSTPTAPVVTGITTDTGTAGDGITSDNTLIINGTSAANTTVTVLLDGASVGSTTADSSGNWSFDYTGTVLADGSYSITATAKNPAGNTSVLSSAYSLVIDTGAPTAPAVTGITTDTGSVGDGVTSDNTLVFGGTAEANSTVTVLINGGSVGTTTADGSGNWSLDHTGTALTDGSYSITATATDSAGNVSAVSAAFNLRVDTVTPAAPAVTGITTDSGAAGDGVTNDNTLIFNGTAEANATVTVLINGSSIGTTTANGSGNWSFDHSATPLADGSYSITATATDGAGNVSAASSAFNVTVDTAVPAAPAVTAITTDTGAAGDGITSDNTLIISGTAEANATVTVLINGASVGTSTANGSGNWSFDHTATPLADGSYSITATASDKAGNASSTSTAFNVTVDTGTPAAPAVTGITTDTGTVGDGITSDNTLIITGTSEVNATVTVLIDGSSIGTATADGSGNWSYDNTANVLPDGAHTITATASDSAGNTSSASAAYTVIVDSAAPAAPVVTGITTDTGTVGDGTTSDNTLIIAGTSEVNATVTVLIDGSSVGTTTADGSGNWSYDNTANVLTDGTHTITATASDSAGNTSSASAAYTVIVDTATPATPVVTGITTDTGTAGDGITSDNTLIISGTAEANATVTVLINGSSVGTTTANGSGNWSFDHTGTVLADGSYSITATATDSAGNASAISTAFTVTVDTTAPAAPAVTGITTDSGTAGDGITNDNTLIFSGTAEANATVTVLINGSSVGTTTANGSGNWSFDHTGTVLADGSYSITATATDSAGNASATSAAFNVTVDTVTPVAPAVTGITTDTGTVGDGITNDNTLIFSGTAEANATVTVLINGSSVGTTTANGSGNWSFDHTGTALADGIYSITATAADTAGNTSAASAAFTVTLDTTAPAAPVVTGITSDTGTAGDGITNDNTLIFSGTAEANATVTVLINGSSVGTTTANGSGNWSFDHTGTVLADGSYSITATATDSAANTSAVSAAFAVTVDTVTPAAPAVTSITTDSGTAGDGITNDNTLIFSGTAEANATVTVLINGSSVGTTTANGSGNWSFDHTGTVLADGSYSITATAADAAGNTSAASAAFTVTVDTTAPAAPAVTGITTDSGTAGDGITNDNTLIFSGTGEANATVTVLINGSSVGTTTANGSGNWSFDHTGTVLADGIYSITATAADTAGNTSAASAAFTVTVDTTAPAAPAVTSITTDSGTAGDGITNDNTLIFSGTAEANATVTVLINGSSVGTTTANGTGNWSFDHTGTVLADGSYSITATATDSAANTSAVSAAFAVTVDTVTPAAPSVTGITTDSGTAGDGITNDNTLIFSGTAEANATVTVLINGSSVGTTTANGTGNWSFDHTGTALADGSYSITAIATDAAGNSSIASSALGITVDTTAPAQPTVSGISTDTGTSASDGITSDSTLVISGTAEAGANVQVLLNGSSIGTTTATAGGAWSFDYTGTSLADGSYAINVTATDTAGNTSPASSTFNLTIDTSAPSSPVISGITTDTGTAGDGITSDNTLLISGTAEANSTVAVLIDSVSVGTTTADGSGNWTFDNTATVLADGAHAITATASDKAGNTSVVSSAYNITIDTVTPAAPVVTGITTDTGTAGDGITSDNTLLINGTSEANATITVLINSVSVGTTTADGSGNWTFDNTATVLADGAHAITATASDKAGNTSVVSSAYNITIDTVTPAAPVVTGITTDTGTAGDGITSDNTLLINGTSEANATITVLINSVSVGTTTANGSGNWSFDHTGTILADGSYSITATATDSSGNTSVASSAFAVTVDTVAPAAPAVTAISTDTGTAGDGITSDNTLVISGTSEANATVTVLIDGSSAGTTTANGAGAWSFDNTANVLTDGAYAITATASDSAGNTSATSAAYNITIDTVTPAAPVVTGITTDTGTAGDGITSDNTLVFNGTSEASATVTVLVNGSSVGTTTADGAGNWSYDYTGTTLADGSYSVTATAGDAAGNTSAASAAFAVTVDTAAPTIASLTPANGATGIAYDANLQITFDAPVYAASGNIVIRRVVDSVAVETISITSANVTGTGTSTLTINPSNNLTSGTQYYVEMDAGSVTDAAGNSFAGISGSATWSFTTATTTLLSTTPTNNSTSIALNTTLSMTFNDTVNAASGNVYIYRSSDSSLYATIDVATATIGGNGTSTITLTPPDTLEPNTSYYINVDAGAFVGAVQGAYAGIYDNSTWTFSTLNTTTPTVTNVTSSVANGTYTDGQTIPIQVQFSEAVTVTGTPQIQINLDGADKYINYSSGSGSNTLVFNYTVTTGDSASLLDYVATSSLRLNGGTIRSAAYANANLTLPAPGASGSLSANKSIAISAASLDISSFTSNDGFMIQGNSTGSYFGRNVGSGGDINGDGYDDIVIGSDLSDVNGVDSGTVWVVYGKPGATRSNVNISSFTSADGFKILGASATDRLGSSVNIVGDLNGDGYDDIVISAPYNDSGATDAGTVYVIWGKPGSTRSDINLASLSSSDGFKIVGYEGAQTIGLSTFIDPHNGQFFDAHGDFNGDGIDDLLIGHNNSDTSGGDSGVAYLIFGQTGATRSDINLGSLGSQGFKITTGGACCSMLGQSVQFVGDFNGDGYDDIVVGSPYADVYGVDAGAAYVIFGHAGPTFNTVDVSALNGSDGFTIYTTESSSWLGGSVSASDVNGDGIPDLLIGNPASNANLGDSGSVLVVYGNKAVTYPDIMFGSVPAGTGFTIYGESVSDFFGTTVKGIPDVDGDGIGDMLVSTWLDDQGGGDAGAGWIIYGKRGTSRSDIYLASLNSNDGFKMIGDQGIDYFGLSNSVGDINGDGYDDAILASPLGDNAGPDMGEVNVIWGKDFRGLVTPSTTGTPGADNLVGTSGNDIVVGNGGADNISAGAGDDIIQVPDLNFSHINGGHGFDTLAFDTGGNVFDLTTLNSQVIVGIEAVDLGNYGNTLIVNKFTVLHMSQETNTLYVKGGAGDVVSTSDASGSWTASGTTTLNSINYNCYGDSGAVLCVQTSISQAGVAN